MGNSPETKSNPEVLKVQESKKNLDEINKKIEFHKTEAERLKQNPNYLNDKLLFAQIFEHEEAIKNLKEEQAKILAESKGYINSQKAEIIPLESKHKESIKNEISENKSLSDEEKQKALQEIENAKTSADLNEINFWDGPMSLILKFFAFITWYTNVSYDSEWNEYDSTIVWEKIKINSQDKLDFVKNAKPVALEIEKKYWIPWQVTIAQSALESGWWKSGLAKKDWNYFWIKAKKWEISAQYKTMEDDWTWKLHQENANFKIFKWMEDSFDWYAKFLTENQRYRKAFAYWADINPKPSYYPVNYEWLDPIKFLIEIAKAWYATDTTYAKTATSIAKWLKDINV